MSLNLSHVIKLLIQEDYISCEKEIKKILLNYKNDFEVNKIYSILLYKTNRIDEALESFIQCEKINSNDAEVSFYIASIYKKKLLFENAITFYKKSIHIRKDFFESYYNIGLVYSEIKKFSEALIFFQKAQELNSKDVDTVNNIGLCFFELGFFSKSKDNYEKALGLNKSHYLSLNNLGLVYLKEKKYIKAKDFFQQSLKINSKYTDAIINLGVTENEIGNDDVAQNLFEKVIKLEPYNSKVYTNLGNLYRKKKNYDLAIGNHLKSISLNENDYKPYNNLGLVYFDLNNFVAAKQYFEKSLDINPNFYEGLVNLALIFQANSKHKEAIEILNKANEIDPEGFSALNNLGNVYMDMGDYLKAKEIFKKAEEKDQLDKSPAYNEGYIDLMLENFSSGSLKYDLRWEVIYKDEKPQYSLNHNLWDGNYVDGTLLIWSEQGLGDHIFYGKLVQLISSMAKTIIFEVDERIIELFKKYFSYKKLNNIVVRHLNKNKPSRDFTKHLPSGSLIKYFKSFHDEKTSDFWKLFSKVDLNLSSDKKKIGLSWKTLNKKEKHRSLKLDDLLPIIQIKNFSFFNLQFGDVEDELAEFYKKKGLKIMTFPDLDTYNDIGKLSSLISSLDFVITAQNTNVHLSGILGKKTYLFLPKNHRWQWGLNRQDSLFYPNVEVFRQKDFGNWKDPVDNLYNKLSTI